ncbi:MAG: DMT family transporter [Clostridiales bacterium]|nr:DMT family transporter [Clostridiales bacterium]
MIHSRHSGPLYLAAASVCWSFGGLCIKFIPWSAMGIVGIRALFAAAVFALFRRSMKVEFTRGNLLSAFCLAATTNLFVFANKLTTAAAAVILQFTAPVFIILIEYAAYKKKPRPFEACAVSAVFFGMLLFFGDRLEVGGILGNLLAIASGLSFAGVFFCNNQPGVDAEQSLHLGFMINAVLGLPFTCAILYDSIVGGAADRVAGGVASSIAGGVMSSIAGAAIGGVASNVPMSATGGSTAWAAAAFLGIVQVGVAYIFFSKGIKHTPPLSASLISALEPVLNPVWVALAGYEFPGAYALAGGAVIIITIVSYNLWAARTKS